MYSMESFYFNKYMLKIVAWSDQKYKVEYEVVQGVSRHSGKSNISLTERKTQVRFYLMIDLLSI